MRGAKDAMTAEKAVRQERAAIAARLIAIAKMPGTHGGGNRHFVSADMVEQECLYGIQDALAALIDELDQAAAMRELPYLYR